jgi:rhomboid protease GluP
VIIDHQFWRLFTSMFVHIGFWHILMNMLCLATAGPLVERLFGHFGLAALFVLSGVGGSILGVWLQPIVVAAGASGAIFGILGGLLGFLAIRYAEVPLSVLRPMRAWAIGFVAYNMIFSMFVPEISAGAHMGGLVTGFFCGLLMTAVSPPDVRVRSGTAPAMLQAGAAGLVAAGLAVLGYTGLDSGKAQIMAHRAADLGSRAASELNSFIAAANPVDSEFERIEQQLQGLAKDLDARLRSKREIAEALRGLKSQSDSLVDRIRAIPAAGSELQAMRDELASAQSNQKQMLDSFDQFLATGDEKHITGAGGLRSFSQAYGRNLKQSESLRDAYVKAHNLRPDPGDESPKR